MAGSQLSTVYPDSGLLCVPIVSPPHMPIHVHAPHTAAVFCWSHLLAQLTLHRVTHSAS